MATVEVFDTLFADEEEVVAELLWIEAAVFMTVDPIPSRRASMLQNLQPTKERSGSDTEYGMVRSESFYLPVTMSQPIVYQGRVGFRRGIGMVSRPAGVRGRAVPRVDLEEVTNPGAVVILDLGEQLVGFGFLHT